MAKKILELFGYSPDDSSVVAKAAREQQTCPMVGGTTLADYPLKNNSLTFVPMRLEASLNPGVPRSIAALQVKTTTVQQVQIAFSSPTNLPEAGAYERAIRAALGENK